MGAAQHVARHERLKCALLDRLLEGMLGMLIGATVALAAYTFTDPLDCLPPPHGCAPGDIGMLLAGIAIFLASAVYLAGGVLYCWRRRRQRRWG